MRFGVFYMGDFKMGTLTSNERDYKIVAAKGNDKKDWFLKIIKILRLVVEF
jgi:hypothetical protein